MKTVLVTGASGFLGHHLVHELLKQADTKVIAILGRPEDKANALPSGTNITIYPSDALFTEKFGNIDTVVNCAFARSNDAKLLAGAFDFTEKLIKRLEEMKVKSAINISSQGVYQRLGVGELSNEESPIEPIDLYSMAKYATEKMFNLSSIPYVTNVRLASILMPQRFLYLFVKKAKAGEFFTVTAPNQYAALLDVKDAASGLSAIVNISPSNRAVIYNLGIGKQYSLLDYAESVKKIGESLGISVSFDVADNGTIVCAGMDSSLLMKDSGWEPSIFKDEMVFNLFKSITF